MFSPLNTESPNPFVPALQHLLNGGRSKTPNQSYNRDRSSSGSIDSTERNSSRTRMSSHISQLTNELQNSSIPLVNFSRSPSPFPRHRSDSNSDFIASEADDDDWGDGPDTGRQLLLQDFGKSNGRRSLIHGGGLGNFLFNTTRGWQMYIGILALWLGGCQIGLVIMNRIILWSVYLQQNYTQHTKLVPLIVQVYEFPYPLTTTLLELLMTHFWLTLSAYITRWVSPWLTSSGCAGGIAPSRPAPSTSGQGFRNEDKNVGFLTRWFQFGTGGIAGGGFFEFEMKVARTVLPCAVIFVIKLCLTNLSFAYLELPVYILARIGVIPLSLLFTYFLSQTQHSVSTISSALCSTLMLLVATIRPNTRVTWEGILAGVLSSIFAALYPVQVQRTYKALVAQLVPQGELLGTFASSTAVDFSGSKEETRAHWRLLHYISILSITLFIPIVLVSGEVISIYRNGHLLDAFFPWLMVACVGIGSWAVFWSTIVLTRSISPLNTTFLFVPRTAFLLPFLFGWKLPVYSWIGIGMCWASCAWFLRCQQK